MAPKIFSQLYIIRAKLGESAVTCSYAILPDKTKDSYKEMFKALLARAEEIGFSLDSLTVHLDFELPTMNGVHMVFGSHVECKGCF